MSTATAWFSITIKNLISGQEAVAYQPGASAADVQRHLFQVLELGDAESSPVKVTVKSMPAEWSPGASIATKA